jgi:hypothetical protein
LGSERGWWCKGDGKVDVEKELKVEIKVRGEADEGRDEFRVVGV